MFLLKPGYLATVALCLFAFAHAYSLDPDGSCNGIQDDLAKAIENASRMAKQASSELGKGFLRGKKVKELTDYLFKSGDINKAKSILGAIGKEYSAAKSDGNKRSPIIYCNFDRLEPISDALGYSNFMHDKQNNFDLLIDTAHKRCEGQTIAGKRAKAYTVSWPTVNKPEYQDFIQLCPWWLEYLSTQEHLSSKLPSNAEMKTTDFPYRDPTKDMPWMDVFMPVEQSLIHEFSHSYLGGNGNTLDHKYLWGECVRISDGTHRCSNADSIGFFALGVEMIKNKGQSITEEGNFERIKK